jgi:shikimate dehydrogenase
MPKRDSEKRKYGLLGKNINYSLSPIIHNTAFAHFNINGEYLIFDTEEEDLSRFIQKELIEGDIRGVNVTVPYKTRALEVISGVKDTHIDRSVTCTGALNTLLAGEKGLKAWNTDVLGFCESLEEDAGFVPQGKKIFINGAGGAGRAIGLFLLTERQAEKIGIFDIDQSRTRSVAGYVAASFGPSMQGRFVPLMTEKEKAEWVSDADLVVNATPLGTYPAENPSLDVSILRSGAVVYDLVYARETELVSGARKRGLTACTGEGMLAGQAAWSFYHWNEDIMREKDPDLEVTRKIMRRALIHELRKK